MTDKTCMYFELCLAPLGSHCLPVLTKQKPKQKPLCIPFGLSLIPVSLLLPPTWSPDVIVNPRPKPPSTETLDLISHDACLVGPCGSPSTPALTLKVRCPSWFFFIYFFDLARSMWKFLGQGSTPRHSSDGSRYSDQDGSLTPWATGESLLPSWSSIPVSSLLKEPQFGLGDHLPHKAPREVLISLGNPLPFTRGSGVGVWPTLGQRPRRVPILRALGNIFLTD